MSYNLSRESECVERITLACNSQATLHSGTLLTFNMLKERKHKMGFHHPLGKDKKRPIR